MAFLTQTAFAKQAGVSRQRISDMCKLGHLTKRPDGKLDTEDQTNKNYLNKRERPDGLKTSDIQPLKIKPKSQNKKVNPKIATNRIVKNPITGDNDDDNDDEEDTGQLKIYKGMDLSRLSKHDLERYHKMISIEEKEIKNEESRKEVIKTELVKQVFHKLYQIDLNIFLQMSHTLSAGISQKIFKSNDAEKITAVAKMINEETYKTQSYIQRQLNDFLESIESDGLPSE